MTKFLALVKKETLVLSKDIQGLVVLFVMPAIFILIMSLALQNAFADHEGIIIDYAITDHSKSELSNQLIAQLRKQKIFSATLLDLPANEGLIAETKISNGPYQFAIVIPSDYPRRLGGNSVAKPVVKVFVAPTTRPLLRQLFVASLRAILVKQKVFLSLAGFDDNNLNLEMQTSAIERLSQVDIAISYVFENNQQATIPSSVQQNVPAWLMFAMFFVIIPISTTFIIEKQQGTFSRLRLMNISALHLLLAKLAPYYVVNQIQMVLMVLVGMHIVPLLGGDRLNWASSTVGLVLISSAASFAAISFALLIATIAKTTVQATTMGGIFNIIFGALGGIMAPKFVMPPFMQEMTIISPMSWGLEGFLDMFLRNAPWSSVLPESTALVMFGIICLTTAVVIFRKMA